MQGFSEKSPNLFEVLAENACNSHGCANVNSAGTRMREGRSYDNICSNLFLIVSFFLRGGNRLSLSRAHNHSPFASRSFAFSRWARGVGGLPLRRRCIPINPFLPLPIAISQSPILAFQPALPSTAPLVRPSRPAYPSHTQPHYPALRKASEDAAPPARSQCGCARYRYVLSVSNPFAYNHSPFRHYVDAYLR